MQEGHSYPIGVTRQVLLTWFLFLGQSSILFCLTIAFSFHFVLVVRDTMEHNKITRIVTDTCVLPSVKPCVLSYRNNCLADNNFS